MKKILLYSFVLSVALASCKKEQSVKPVAANEETASFEKKANFACPAPPQLLGVLTWGNTGNDWAAKIAFDQANNVTISGIFQNTVDFNPGAGVFNLTAISAPRETAYTQRLNSAGAFISAKVEGVLNEWMTEFIEYKQYRYVNQEERNPGGDEQHNRKQYLAKYQGGTLLWRVLVGTTNVNGRRVVALHSMAVDSEGNVFTSLAGDKVYKYSASGTLLGSVTHDEPEAMIHIDSQNNLFLFGVYTGDVQKFSPQGSRLWKLRSGSSTEKVPMISNIATDKTGNVYITGIFFESGDFNPGAGTFNLVHTGKELYNLYLQKLDGNGQFVWAVQTKPAATKGAYLGVVPLDVKLDSSEERIAIAGYYGGKVDFGTGSPVIKQANGVLDAFLLCYQQCK